MNRINSKGVDTVAQATKSPRVWVVSFSSQSRLEHL